MRPSSGLCVTVGCRLHLWVLWRRLESEPGEETQIDYGKMGTREVETRRRVVYAFCGKLCASRLPYIQYCTSQDALSFALSF